MKTHITIAITIPLLLVVLATSCGTCKTGAKASVSKPAIVASTADSGAGSLRDVVANASAGETIIFNIPMDDSGYDAESGKWTITLSSGEIKFDKHLTFNGGGSIVLNGNNASRMLYYKGDDSQEDNMLALNGLTFINGSACGEDKADGGEEEADYGDVDEDDMDRKALGGAVLVAGGVLVGTDCVFSNNTASAVGGAVLVIGGEDTPTAHSFIATNCVFYSNSAGDGGAVGVAGSVSVAGCVFAGNIAAGYDENGADIVEPGAYVDGWAGQGGAVWAFRSVKAIDCVFSNNAALGVNDAGCKQSSGGGAVASSKSVIATGCVFTGNTSDSDGGAVVADFMAAENCVFSGNAANNTSGNGGAVWAERFVIAANSSFVGNRTGWINLGAISARGGISLYHCTVADNIGAGAHVRNADDDARKNLYDYAEDTDGADDTGDADAAAVPAFHAYNSIIAGNRDVGGNIVIQAGFGNKESIAAFASDGIAGASLIEGVTAGVSRESVFGGNKAGANGIMAPLPGGLADKNAAALTAEALTAPGGIDTRSLIDALQNDISGAARSAAGNVSYGCKE